MALYRLSSPWSADNPGSVGDLHRRVNELFERAGSGSVRRGGAYPPVNLYESADAYLLSAELPGVPSDAIDVSVEGNRVTLKGERKVEHPEDGSLHRAERPSGVFRRTVELPIEVDAEKAEAVHRSGILMLRIPKAEEHKPRRIAVRPS